MSIDQGIRAAVKKQDGFVATFFTSKISIYFVQLFAKLGVKPNAVTMMALGVSLICSWLVFTSSRVATIIAAILIQLAFVLDCTDGQLARYTKANSHFGAWLDAFFDRVKEYILIFCLSYGSMVNVYNGDTRVLVWGFISIILVSLNHLNDIYQDYYQMGRDHRVKAQLDKATQVYKGKNKKEVLIYWIKVITYFTIGERMAVVSILLLFNLKKEILLFYMAAMGFRLVRKTVGGWVKYLRSC